MANLPQRYNAAALNPTGSTSFTIRNDQFHSRPTATCVREYLEMRKRVDLGPASLNEIFDALIAGGYQFNTKNDQVSKVSLANQLTKNPVFYRLPNKLWGLLEWYPKAKRNVTIVSANTATADQDGEEPQVIDMNQEAESTEDAEVSADE